MNNEATATIQKLEKTLRLRSKIEQRFREIDAQLGGAFEFVKSLQSELRAYWNQKRLWSDTSSEASRTCRELIDKCSQLLETLNPEKEPTIAPATFLPGNSPYRISTKYDATTGVTTYE